MPSWFKDIAMLTVGTTGMIVLIAGMVALIGAALDDWFEPAFRIFAVILLPILILAEIALFGFFWLGWK